MNSDYHPIRRQARFLVPLGALPALAVMLMCSPGMAHSQEQAGSGEQPCELTFIPERPREAGDHEGPVPGRMQISPGCEFFYFPGMDEKELTSNPELWKYTGGKSHFRITSDGRLLFMVNRDMQPAPAAPATGAPAAATPPPPAATMPDSGKLAELARERDRLQARNKALEAQLAKLQAERQSANQALGKKLQDSRQHAASLLAEVKELKQRNDACLAALETLRREKEQLSPRLAALQTRLENALEDDDGDGVPNQKDQCPGTTPGMATDAQGCIKLDLPGVTFATASARLNWKSKVLLDHAAQALKNLDVTLEVQGHTDNRGNPEANLALSQRRAEVVASYLESRGVKAEHLVARGYGDQRPIADNETPQGRAKNRRVTLVRLRK